MKLLSSNEIFVWVSRHMHEAQENAREKEKAYNETLVLLRWAQSGTPTATSQLDLALIQSLEGRLYDANQQLRQIHEEHSPNAADGQMSVQQSQETAQGY